MNLNLRLLKTIPAKVVLIHIVCWALFIIYELASVYYAFGELEPARVYLIYYPINISFFYCNAALLNYAFGGKTTKYLRGTLLFILILITYCLIKFSFGYLTQTGHRSINLYFHSFTKVLASTVFRIAYFTILSTFYWATGHISNFRKQAAAAEKQELIALKDKAELENRLAEARNAYLTHQLNPHLLFNSLNFIYNSVFQNSPAAAKCVVLLSEIMHFSLKETGPDSKVVLSNEIDQVRRLVEINRYRFDKPLAIKTKFNGRFKNHRVIPLILFTLAENLFKHGNVLDRKHPALLTLTVDNEGKLTFYCKNLKKANSDEFPGQQIGLRNVRLRLDFAYQDNYTLSINEDDDFYQTSLTINL